MNFQKRILFYLNFIFIVFACSNQLFAQTPPQLVNLTPPSPNMAAFQKYGDIPVSAYTGVPNISIPIYTIKFRDITVPISLSYHASGIKVFEEASQVGLGWTLNAGGNISRNIMGEDDFNGSVYFNGPGNDVMDISGKKGPTNYTPIGCVTPMYDKTGPQTLFNFDASPYFSALPYADFQPDQYYYNFLNKSGKFVLNRLKQAIIQKQESVAINVLTSNGSSWQVKSEDGYTYDFASNETYQDGVPLVTHFSAWYLTKITSPTGNIVIFKYTLNSHLITSVGSYSESRDDYDQGAGGQSSGTLGSSAGFSPGKSYNSMVLSSIDFTVGRVVFSYSDNRSDLTGEKRLDDISVFNTGEATPIKSYSLVYDFFNGVNDPSFNIIGTTVPATVSQRLKLTQLIENGFYNGQTIQSPPYIFSYNESNSFPAKTSFARDHWGYFNGVTGRVSLIPNVISINTTDQITSVLGLSGLERESNPYWATAFNINSIKYPTGGWTNFEFESNDFDEKASQVKDYSYFNQQNSTLTQKTQTVGYDALGKYYLGTTNMLDLTNEYVVPAAQGGGSPAVSISASFRFLGGTGGNCNDVGITNPGLMYFELKDINGNLISHIDPGAMLFCSGNATSTCVICQTGSPVLTYTTTYQLPPGKYTWTAFVGTSGAALKLQDIHSIFSWYEGLSTSPANAITTGGGLRIKRIIDHDGIDERNNKIKRFDYHYRADKTGTGTSYEYSYGKRMSKPQYSHFLISLDDYSTVTSGTCYPNIYYSYHLIRTSDSNIPLNGSAGGSVVGYDQVTQFLGENGEYGKTTYQYVNDPDIVSPYAEPYTLRSLPMRPPYGSSISNNLNGSLLNESNYANINGSFFKVKEEFNQYNTLASNENIVCGMEPHFMKSLQLGDKCNSINMVNCASTTMLFWYQALQSEWNYLSNKKERIYNDKGDEEHYQETLTNFYYDNPQHLQLSRIVTTNSKGQQVTSTTKYPLDFTVPAGATDPFAVGVQNLQTKHIINTPVEKYIQKLNADGSNMGATSYGLTEYGNTLPSPALAYTSMLSAPNAAFVPSAISGTGQVTKDNAYQPLIYFDSYDANGNLKQQHKFNDINHSYIWDYYNSQLIAEVSNAAANEIAFTSFESDGSGNWTIPSTLRNIGSSISGNQCYTITGTPITTTVPNGKSYIVSYWSKAGALSVNGAASTQGLTKGLWTYFEHVLPAGTTSISVGGTGIVIDELRLYPKDAQMTSYTLSPLIGTTSVCNTANVISYYVYDGLGRLQLIKDWDGNILKTYEYHFTGTVVQ